MQLLAERGEEYGSHEGLGWITGAVRLIERDDPAIKVPHMGWNDVRLARPHPLVVPGEAYFLHSYHFEAADEAHVFARTDRSEEHTSELQSLLRISYAVFCLKKKNNTAADNLI